jgi:AraC family transcriptional regulator, positive regulator of tynA and feaB
MSHFERDGIKRWSTADVATTTRLDYFAAALSEATFPVRVDNADPLSFHAEVSAANLGTVSVCKAAGSPHGTFRGRSELAQTDGHLFNLTMTLQSIWTAEHRGSLRMLPRDVLIFDSQYPLRTDVLDPFVAIHVVVSEAWLRDGFPIPMR